MQLSLLDYVLTTEEATAPATQPEPPSKKTPQNLVFEPPFKVNAGDRLRLVKGFHDHLIGQIVVVIEMRRPCVAVGRLPSGEVHHFWLPNTEKLEESGSPLLLWHQAKIDHRRRVILELSLSDPTRYAALIQQCEREIEQALKAMLTRSHEKAIASPAGESDRRN
ncbi:hypothetical protein ACKFKG_26875 [Phormidesmis sp. 146-35]